MKFLRGFVFAYAGLRHAFLTQINFRVHCAAVIAVSILAIWLHASAAEIAVLALAAGSVITTELINTAIEAIVDKTSPEHHELARVAKDCAAGAVLAAALGAAVAGLFILGPKLVALLLQ